MDEDKQLKEKQERQYHAMNQSNAERLLQSFYHELESFSWEECHHAIMNTSAKRVEEALQRAGHGTLEDFAALISPAAQAYLEPMAQLSHRLTLKRFGKVVSMYVPLYLSNVCTNSCVYCGYNHQNSILRHTLSPQEIEEEAQAIQALGFDHILLLTGEAPRDAGFDYLCEAIKIVRPYFHQISIEVQPLDIAQYEKLVELGLYGVYVYQETYREQRYPAYHPAGRKANYRYRLETPDRIGIAGTRKIGIGALLGLEDWRVESFCTAMHLRYLQKRYWRSCYSVSFPRLRPHVGTFEPKYPVGDRDLLQLICAYRLFDADIEMALTTREGAFFRDHAFPLGITSLSAGSHTEPGGYAHPNEELVQFDISDARSPEEVATMVKEKGYEPVWKAWDPVLQ